MPPTAARARRQDQRLIALALSVAAPATALPFTQALVRLGATRQEVDEMLGVTTTMGGGPSLMYAASAAAAFDEFAQATGAPR